MATATANHEVVVPSILELTPSVYCWGQVLWSRPAVDENRWVALTVDLGIQVQVLLLVPEHALERAINRQLRRIKQVWREDGIAVTEVYMADDTVTPNDPWAVAQPL